MRIPAYHTRGDISENTMTSMIDVVFLLLIFFVCAATGQIRESLLPADLAAGSAASTVTVERPQPVDEVWIYLSVGADSQPVMKLNGTEYESFDALKETLLALAEVSPECPVVLDIAPDVDAGQMIRVYDTCRAARFTSINFKTERPVRKQPQP